MDVQATLAAIAADAARGDMVFPTHAELALRIRQALDDPDGSLEQLAKLIAAEPILATRVVHLANSVAYNPGGQAVSDVRAAVARLGFGSLRALVAALIVRQMQATSASAEQRALAARLWEHTAHVAALARVIARRVTHQDPEAAFFAGIVHEVGAFYLLARAEHYPGLLHSQLAAWYEHGEAPIGQAVSQALAIPENIRAALDTLWTGYLAMPPESLGDTLLLADQLAPVESPLAELAGMSRQGMALDLDVLLDDATLSSVLADSAEEVASLIAALAA